MNEVALGRFYRGRVRIRRGPRWPVRSEAEPLDGRDVLVQTGWVIEEDDHSLYVGEHAMLLPADTPAEIGWIASGDFADLREEPFEDGLAAWRRARESAREQAGAGEGATRD